MSTRLLTLAVIALTALAIYQQHQLWALENSIKQTDILMQAMHSDTFSNPSFPQGQVQ